MQIEMVEISSLVFDPNNARKHDVKNLNAIKGSLRRFGAQKPIVISQNNVVIAGNGTIAAAMSLGWKTLPAVRSNLDGFMQTAFALADNKTAELAEWDDKILRDSLDSLKIEGFDITEIGFDDISLSGDDDTPIDMPEKEWLLVVECPDEESQSDLFSEFQERGLKCKIM